MFSCLWRGEERSELASPKGTRFPCLCFVRDKSVSVAPWERDDVFGSVVTYAGQAVVRNTHVLTVNAQSGHFGVTFHSTVKPVG